MNPLRLETKQEESCSWFNKKWYIKKYQEFHESRKKFNSLNYEWFWSMIIESLKIYLQNI